MSVTGLNDQGLNNHYCEKQFTHNKVFNTTYFFQKFNFVMEHPVFYATTVFRARGCIRLLRIRDLRYGRTLSGSKNLKSGRKKHPSPSTRPQPQKRATFLIEAAAASINLLLLLLLGICHLGSYNNIFLANYAYVYYNEGSYPFFRIILYECVRFGGGAKDEAIKP